MDASIHLPAPKTQRPNCSSKPRDRHHNRSKESSSVEKVGAKNLLMGDIKILKRGEVFIPDKKNCRSDSKSSLANKKELVLEYTERRDSVSRTVKKQVRLPDFKFVNCLYSGAAYIRAPPPSSVPLPLILCQKETSTFNSGSVAD